MPLNSTDFNQILNIAPSGHLHTIQDVIKDTSPSQKQKKSSSTPARTLEISSIFEGSLVIKAKAVKRQRMIIIHLK